MRVRVWGMVALYIDHGTQLMQLKPSSILAAAEEDVVRFPGPDCDTLMISMA